MGGCGAVVDRLKLFAVELNEEKIRLLQNLVLVQLAVFLGAMAAIFASLSVVVIFWETARLTVMLSLAAGYLIGCVAVALVVRRRLAMQPRPFEATIEELEQDRSCLQRES